MSTRSRLIPIGYTTKAHGIRGEVSLMLEAESPEILRGDVFLQPRGASSESSLRPYVVEKMRTHHGALLVTFAGVSTRTDAELLRGHTVFVSRDTLVEEKGDVYLDDLLSLRVVVEDEAGAPRDIGVISGVDTPAGQELWAITSPDGKEILFPAVPEFVRDIDLDAGIVRIAPPPGLLELYLGEG